MTSRNTFRLLDRQTMSSTTAEQKQQLPSPLSRPLAATATATVTVTATSPPPPAPWVVSLPTSCGGGGNCTSSPLSSWHFELVGSRLPPPLPLELTTRIDNDARVSLERYWNDFWSGIKDILREHRRKSCIAIATAFVAYLLLFASIGLVLSIPAIKSNGDVFFVVFLLLGANQLTPVLWIWCQWRRVSASRWRCVEAYCQDAEKTCFASCNISCHLHSVDTSDNGKKFYLALLRQNKNSVAATECADEEQA